MSADKTIEYYKINAEQDYMTTPISVLRYISELEEVNYQKMFANCNLPNEKPQPQEKVLSAKEYLLDNLKEFPNHDEYDPKLIDAIADFMNGFANYRLNTLQDNGLRKAAEEYLNVVNNAMSFDNMVEYHKAAKAARAKLEKQLK